ncbi:hypothetical protein DSO57_1030510 [Entomophthora muscae]|uniref:Uncharacterized protein n=2 Tax=Entomophthora muscae TaxID=34485 RepID=A0ACC2TC07_9FUNG|nr:hypothetical protein DSO57_1030510 [Entomophthora muscae]
MVQPKRRSTRKRTSQYATETPDWSKISSSHYVGYVEDGESITAIMKKFEELERLKEEAAQGIVAKSDEDSDGVFGLNHMLDEPRKPVKNSTPKPTNKELTQEQLEELFIRTSCFTLESADAQTRRDLGGWTVEEQEAGMASEYSEEEDCLDSDDEEWVDEELPEERKRGYRQNRGSRVRTREQEREAAIRRYREATLRDASGNALALIQRPSLVDPSKPKSVAIPPNPVKSFWGRELKLLPALNPDNSHLLHRFKLEAHSEQLIRLGKNLQAILMDPPLLLDGEDSQPFLRESVPAHRQPIRISQLRTFPIPKMLLNGFLMIWVEKRHLHQVLNMCTQDWGLRYVENVAWVYLNVDNSIAALPVPEGLDHTKPSYIRSSKAILLIFRKDGEIDLRHQRSPDCILETIRPSFSQENPLASKFRTERPHFVYDLIETLLPEPANSPPGCTRFLELWACPSRSYTIASPWTAVIDEQRMTSTLDSSDIDMD